MRLDEVRAYDAADQELPATMQVTATGTRILVDGTALASVAGAGWPLFQIVLAHWPSGR